MRASAEKNLGRHERHEEATAAWPSEVEHLRPMGREGKVVYVIRFGLVDGA